VDTEAVPQGYRHVNGCQTCPDYAVDCINNNGYVTGTAYGSSGSAAFTARCQWDFGCAGSAAASSSDPTTTRILLNA